MSDTIRRPEHYPGEHSVQRLHHLNEHRPSLADALEQVGEAERGLLMSKDARSSEEINLASRQEVQELRLACTRLSYAVVLLASEISGMTPNDRDKERLLRAQGWYESPADGRWRKHGVGGAFHMENAYELIWNGKG